MRPKVSDRVEFLLDGGWADTDNDSMPEYWRTFDQTLTAIDSPEELHTFVDWWNWDGGTQPILRALAHPLCDRGTGLMVYWRVDPIFYLKPGHRTREEVQAKLWPDAVVHWDLLRELEHRLETNAFHSARVPYDPTNDRGRDRTKHRRKRPPRAIIDKVNNEFVILGYEPRPEEPEIDVHGLLPAYVFMPVTCA